jgi:DNA-binding NarL/FixJ family response regulator
MITILLIDDHHMIRAGLRRLLEDQPDMTVLGEADNGRDAVALAAQHAPTVVVMDLNMPQLNGIEATRQIVAATPQVKVVCLSAQSSATTATEVLKAGAEGYVLKDSVIGELVTAIRTVAGGKTYLSPVVAKHLVGDLRRSRDEPSTPASSLTAREREILQLICEGQSTKQVARALNVSGKTVEAHRRNLMEKLKLDSVAELTKFAVREGFTSL